MRFRPSLWLLGWFGSAALAVAHCGFAGNDAGLDDVDGASVAPDSAAAIDARDDRPEPPEPAPRGLEAIEVVTGDASSCALDTAGRVYCWGSNEAGQLGLSLGVASVSVPRRVALPPGVKVIHLAGGAEHTCALTDRADLVCWGRNHLGQVGRTPSATAAPDLVTLPSALATATFVAVAAGGAHTCALYLPPQLGDGGEVDAGGQADSLRLACWGANGSGQLARDDVPFAELPADVRRNGSSGPAVAAGLAALGGAFSVASLRSAEGSRVQVWGSAAGGVLGSSPDAGARSVPSVVTSEGGSPLQGAFSLHAGTAHACALLSRPTDSAGDASADADGPDAAADAAQDGSAAESSTQLVCWGANDRGQLGRGGASAWELPVGSSIDPGATLALGGQVSCVLSGGILRCAGSDDQGQLGIGAADEAPHPTLTAVVQPSGTIVAASVGAQHACAVVETAPRVRQIACWGDNRSGQLGDGMSVGAGYDDSLPADRFRRTRPVFVAPAE